jgi:hypothetical protein
MNDLPVVAVERIELSFAPRPAELADIAIVRSRADLDPRMPAFVTAFLTDFWSTRAS